jgi:DNA-binding response OmpR family regulator
MAQEILIIDDDINHASFMMLLLEDAGYRCSRIASGERALEQLQQDPLPDLILLDIMLEGIDGYEVCKRIKTDTRLRVIPVIILSGRSSIDEKILGLELGADDYLIKPVKTRELLARISLLLRLRSLQDQMAQVEKLAGLGQLAAGIAHEFNNLIGGMLGYAQLAMLTPDNREMTLKALTVVEKSCFRAKELTENMLLFSTHSDQPAGLAEIRSAMDHASVLLASQLSKNQIELIQDYHHTQVLGIESGRLLQLLMSLLQNSIHAIMVQTAGPRTIHLRTSDKDIMVEITIRDTGCGIGQDQQTRIFEPFFTTKGPLGGGDMGATGIGLSVAHGIAASYGGKLELVESAPGKGSTFRLSLPISKHKSENPAQPENAPNPEVSLAHLSVLVADDEQVYRDLLVDMLSGMGISAESAPSGEEAVRENSQASYDVIFLDYLMPGMGGIEAATRLRAQGYKGAIIFVSGRTILPNLQNALEIQRAEYLAKPFEIAEVRELLTRIVSRKQAK